MTMLRLMKLAKDNRRNWQLLLAGKCHIPDQRREAEDFIAQHELDDNVRLTGWEHYVPWQHMVPLYSRAHVGLALFDRHQNPEKSLLTKFYEYMHYGLPICCSEFARWKSFIEDFDVGFTVGFGDYSAAFSGLDRMISESDRYPRLSRNAAKEAPNYRWEVMEKRLLDMYRLLIHNPPTETS